MAWKINRLISENFYWCYCISMAAGSQLYERILSPAIVGAPWDKARPDGRHTAKDSGILRKTRQQDPASESFSKQSAVLASLTLVWLLTFGTTGQITL
jgi:hypothetical protein